jgi:glycosyltransferase involved in cell wall biosynthesis
MPMFRKIGKGGNLMRSLTLNDLPAPPRGKSGWPWTEENPQCADAIPNGWTWGRVSIVTPSFNQGQFIEETIRSVLLQGYPDLEYIIIDGGSTDESLDIIKKYEPWLSGWVSESDYGQSHAINKGLKRSTGEFWAWLNSDDIYMPGTIFRSVKALKENSKAAIVYGYGLWMNEDSIPIDFYRSGPLDARSLLTGSSGHGIPQATAFMRREAVESVGGLNEKLHMAMDYELWIKLSFHYNLQYLPGPPFAGIRSHVNMKTRKNQLEAYLEDLQILRENLNHPLCPHGLSLFRNREYVIGNLGVARNYLAKNMLLKALPYILKAVNADFFFVMKKPFKYFNKILTAKKIKWTKFIQALFN